MADLALHLPVPDANNDVGVNFRAALVSSGIGLRDDGRRTVLPSGVDAGEIDPAEEAMIDSGQLFEVIRGAATDDPSTAVLDALFAQVRTEVQADLAVRLQFFGFERTVP